MVSDPSGGGVSFVAKGAGDIAADVDAGPKVLFHGVLAIEYLFRDTRVHQPAKHPDGC